MALSRTAGRLVALAVVSLALAACGGTPQASVDPGERPDLPVGGSAPGTPTSRAPGTPATGAPEPVLPAVTVWDVGAKQWVQLADFLPADKPLLVWFWAPH